MTGTNHQGSVEIDADELWTHEEPLTVTLAKGQDWQVDMVTLNGSSWCEVTMKLSARSAALGEVAQTVPTGLTLEAIDEGDESVTLYYGAPE